MTNKEYKIEGLTIAVVNMDEMLKFYSSVFSIEFQEQDMFGSKLYSGQWDLLKILLCPADLAGIDVHRNRQQFDIKVRDLDEILKIAFENGGKAMGEVQSSPESKAGSVFDPDGNSIVFKEYV
ncbi:MAG: VOC family protein [Cyclobacteriaceae bacterium]